MMNPNHATAMLDDICEILSDSRFFKFLHIPVQSGSDKVLNEMRRQYQAAEFTQLVKTLRSRIPDITLSTDIIVGYPTETDRDFQLTIDLIQQTKPDVTNISKYGHRPGTPAAQLTSLSSATINQRSRRTSLLCQTLSLQSNLRMIGKIQEISLTDRTREEKPIGRTYNYKKTILDKDMPIGTKIRIKVTKASQRHLEATPI
jgi:tRNA A37 methylthiotransferase MiaB